MTFNHIATAGFVIFGACLKHYNIQNYYKTWFSGYTYTSGSMTPMPLKWLV
jgi:hypothetical protein